MKAKAVRRFVWQEYNLTYGPWYRMRQLDKRGVSVTLEIGGKSAEAVVQPNMDRSGWYWSVRFTAYRPRVAVDKQGRARVPLPDRKIGGRAASKRKAQAMAESAFLTGRPVPLEVTP